MHFLVILVNLIGSCVSPICDGIVLCLNTAEPSPFSVARVLQRGISEIDENNKQVWNDQSGRIQMIFGVWVVVRY